MPLDKISVSRTFHLGDSNFFKIGQEGTIAEGETREQLTADAINYIYATLAKYCPQIDDSIIPPIIIEKPISGTKEEAYGETLEQQIRSCKSMAVLKIYEKREKTTQEQKAYNEKLKELSKK
jgi:hypothetical protein